VTQDVKRGRAIETRSRVHYNLRVSKAILALMCAPLLMGSACEKKPAKAGDTGAVNALDRAGGDTPPSGPVDESPLPGITIDKLSGSKQKLFYKLIGSLSSPCGKAHSLRTSFTSDTECKRAPFAVRYVAALLEDEASETQAREEYDAKYKASPKPVQLDVSKAPRVGSDDAPIRIVEFFDYQCPHCAMFKASLDQIAARNEGRVVEYFMMFPLEKHTDSRSAAQAALAAAQQGKFKEMHEALFARSPRHKREHVVGYATELGLDAAAFEAAYEAAAPVVADHIRQGDAAGVQATPTLFFNDRKYEGPMDAKYIQMWIDEELAVNR
jgi:protein-disulfide isomerase